MRNPFNKLEENLNSVIGISWWKKYIASAFWSNISTPINFSITLLTTLNTGQATTGNLLSNDIYINLSIVTLVLSTINTFFKPNDQYNRNLQMMNIWYDFGNRFENIYFTILDDKEKFNAYVQLQQDINKFENSHSSNSINIVADLIYVISVYSCLQKRDKWLDTDKEFINEIETHFFIRRDNMIVDNNNVIVVDKT
jgi:hypothetical protein